MGYRLLLSILIIPILLAMPCCSGSLGTEANNLVGNLVSFTNTSVVFDPNAISVKSAVCPNGNCGDPTKMEYTPVCSGFPCVSPGSQFTFCPDPQNYCSLIVSVNGITANLTALWSTSGYNLVDAKPTALGPGVTAVDTLKLPVCKNVDGTVAARCTYTLTITDGNRKTATIGTFQPAQPLGSPPSPAATSTGSPSPSPTSP